MSKVTAEQVRAALIKLITKVASDVKTFAASVESVDEDKHICTVKPIDGGAVYHKVKLKPVVDQSKQGVILIPVIGSYVLVGRLTNPNDTFVMMVSEVSKVIIKTTEGTIELNGNDYSMVKGKELQQQINKTNAAVSAILNAINNAIPSGNPDAGLFLQNSMKAIIAGHKVGDFSDILNDNVKHG